MPGKRKITGTKPLFGQSRSKSLQHRQAQIQAEPAKQAYLRARARSLGARQNHGEKKSKLSTRSASWNSSNAAISRSSSCSKLAKHTHCRGDPWVARRITLMNPHHQLILRRFQTTRTRPRQSCATARTPRHDTQVVRTQERTKPRHHARFLRGAQRPQLRRLARAERRSLSGRIIRRALRPADPLPQVPALPPPIAVGAAGCLARLPEWLGRGR